MEEKEFIVLILSIIVSTATGASQKYLGCWMDTTADPDLNDLVTTSDNMDLAACVSSCGEAGFAYCGLQAGYKCRCGNKYGLHGQSTACNFTCDGVPCGGFGSSNIYYAIDTDVTTRARRELIGHNQPKSYFSARQECVQNNGDLVVMRNEDFFNSLQAAANTSGITSDRIWIGLFWNSNNQYAWTDPSVNGLNFEAESEYWKSDETHDQKCVLLSLSSKYWMTASCSSPYPYVCFQLPAAGEEEVTTEPDNTELIESEPEKGFFEDNKKLVLYLVLPLFVLCYGGSCVIYAIGKGWRYFRKRQREKVLQAMLANSTEFEPDTKPLTERRPLTSRDVKMEEGYTNSPPPYYRVNSRTSKSRSPIEKEQATHTPVQKFTFDEDTKPRVQSRTSSRRSELLENAYSEARERRRREGSTPQPPNRPRSSRSPRMSDLDVPVIPPPPSTSSRSTRSSRYEVPSISTIPEEEGIDYTKLSIGDIMYIRDIMATAEGEKKKRKKPRKIIVA